MLSSTKNITKLEDTLQVKLNSLSKCLEYGQYISEDHLNLVLMRIEKIAKKHYEANSGLVLTWGTNGNCGRFGKWYDKLTIKYGFRYNSISCSCIVGNIPKLVEAYNSFAYKVIKERNGRNWEKNLEKEILSKKRKIKFNIENPEIRNLEEVHISLRDLKKYPKEIEKLTKLKKLYFNINRLTKLEEGICNLTQLELIGLHSNKFKTFPQEIVCLKNLKKIYLDKNKLRRIPSEIQKLQALEEINLGNNKLKKLPEEISNLNNLSCLDLRDNRLTSLPNNFHNLTKLKTLILWDNKLQSVPISLFEMNQLETLFIDIGNEIPKSEIEKLKIMLPNTEIK